MNRRLFVLEIALGVWALAAAPAPAQTGVQKEVRVQEPTRLDWQFAASGFGREAAEVGADYDSRKQRYLLYVPKDYKADRAWPLVAYISPSNDPGGWSKWQKICEQNGMLFCGPYDAGNNCAAGKRTRIVLDVLDDVRRHYRIDADRTYLTGFSGGGRMACTIALSLPEYFGGVVPVCGTNPLPRLTYLRHRIHDRLSVAFVTGESDFNRKENEDYMAPYFEELGIRTRLWVVPKMGHAIPGPEVLSAVAAWLGEDLKRRRADSVARLLPKDSEAPTAEQQAQRLLSAAQTDLKQADRTWSGVVLLQGVVARWPKTPAGVQARKLLREVQEDAKLLERVEKQGGADERMSLFAQAKALDRFGRTDKALEAWTILARDHPNSTEGKQAAAALRRSSENVPAGFLGLALAGDTKVTMLVPKGPADRAGVKKGDVLRKLGGTAIGSPADLARAMQGLKPGERVRLEVSRDGEMVVLTVEIGTRPPP